MTTSEQKLKGIIVPMVTPLTSDGRIDEAGTARLVEHMIKGGVHGIFVLGSTGEAHCLPARARHDFVRLVGRLVAGRVPLLAGVTDTSLEDSLLLAQTAAESGACRIVAAAPYYYHHTQDDLLRWYTSLADAGVVKDDTSANPTQSPIKNFVFITIVFCGKGTYIRSHVQSLYVMNYRCGVYLHFSTDVWV